MTEPTRPLNPDEALRLILDHVDYTHAACSPIERVGACLPYEVILACQASLEAFKARASKSTVQNFSDYHPDDEK